MRLILVTILAASAAAHAEAPRDSSSETTGFDPHFEGDARLMMLIRDDNNYFTHASKWNYDLPREAGGFQIGLGAALTSRVSVYGEGFYAVDGADRDSAKLRLASGALLAVVKGTIVRGGSASVWGELSARGGFGRYYIKETYVDPSLSPMVYSTSVGSFGGFGGVEASITMSAFRAVLAYSYHYAPATIDDRVRGSVDAGGHEVSFGVGVRL